MKLLLALYFLSLPVLAEELYYLTPESVDLSAFAAPPAPDSPQDIADWQAVLAWQNTRSALDCERVMVENEGTSTAFYGPPYGPLTQAQSDKLLEMQERLFDEVNYFARILKTRWSRPRPFVRDSTITPCISAHATSGSYPSGHAAIARLSALTFSLIHPAQHGAIKDRAKLISEGRVLGGVHYPSDVAAGKRLGDKVFKALMKIKTFRTDVNYLK